mmetsp:Transcript_9127/g.41460  ORF Transcript_9127/g.41460 Transcript_9127/m.41460 type:complete len:213 (+) Transcript_9127:2628-3266(+)
MHRAILDHNGSSSCAGITSSFFHRNSACVASRTESGAGTSTRLATAHSVSAASMYRSSKFSTSSSLSLSSCSYATSNRRRYSKDMPRRVVRSRGISGGLASRSDASFAAVSAFAALSAALHASSSAPSSIAALYAFIAAVLTSLACSASLSRRVSEIMCSRLDSMTVTVSSNLRRSIFNSARMFTSVASALRGNFAIIVSSVSSAASGFPMP